MKKKVLYSIVLGVLLNGYFANATSVPKTIQLGNGNSASANMHTAFCFIYNPGCLIAREKFFLETEVRKRESFLAIGLPYDRLAFAAMAQLKNQSTMGLLGFAANIEIQPKLYGGINLWYNQTNQAYVVDSGIFTLIPVEYSLWKYFGFWNLSAGFSVLNLLNLGNDFSFHQKRNLRTFFSWRFIKTELFLFDFYFDGELRNDFSEYLIHFSARAQLWNWFTLGLGYEGKELFIQQPLSVSAGVVWSDYLIRLNSEVSYRIDQSFKNDFAVYFNAGYNFRGFSANTTDEEDVNEYFFSPNFDGVKDLVEISVPEIADLSDDWKLVIRNNTNKFIRQIVSSKALDFDGTPLRPGIISWNGLSEEKSMAPAGKYFASLIWKKGSSFKERKIANIILDSVAPVIKLENVIMEKQEDLLKLNLSCACESSDKLNITVLDDSGENIRAWSFQPEAKIFWQWDFQDANGRKINLGGYLIKIETFDTAGNSSQDRHSFYYEGNKQVRLAFSRNMHLQAESEKLIIKPEIPKDLTIKKWELILVQENIQNVLRTGSVVPESIEVNLTESVFKNNLAEKIFFFFKVETSTQSHLSMVYNFKLHSGAADFLISHEPGRFEDYGASRSKNNLLFHIYPKTELPLETWNFNIENGNEKFMVFSGNGDIPLKFQWSGYGLNKNYIDGWSKYEYYISGKDIFGRSFQTAKKTLETGIIVHTEGDFGQKRSLNVSIPGAEFVEGSSVLQQDFIKNIKALYKLANLYGKYNILIEGHTDNRGIDAFNKNLSLERAESLKTILIQNGIGAQRINTIGYGKEKPKYDNDTEQGRFKNRRIEVILYSTE